MVNGAEASGVARACESAPSCFLLDGTVADRRILAVASTGCDLSPSARFETVLRQFPSPSSSAHVTVISLSGVGELFLLFFSLTAIGAVVLPATVAWLLRDPATPVRIGTSWPRI